MDSLTAEAYAEDASLRRNLEVKFIWDYFLPSNACPYKEKLGSQPNMGDNGKWVCGARTILQRGPCVVYSFGCGLASLLRS
jgi:hypothetical protein